MTGANYLEDEILKFLGKTDQATAGHHPHRLLGQGTAGAAPQRPGGALAGVLRSCQLSDGQAFEPSPDKPHMTE